MSSDAHGTLSADDDLSNELDPKTRRRVMIIIAVCALIVIAVAVFVVVAAENPGSVVKRVQDQRETLVPALQAVFA